MIMDYSVGIDFPYAMQVPPIDSGRRVKDESFARCIYCDHVWAVRDEFLNDPDVFLAGHRANSMRAFIASATQGVFVFVHHRGDCGSNILVAPEMLRERPLEE